MLEFAPSPQFQHHQETASEHFNAGLSFGASGTIKFDGVKGPLTVSLTPSDYLTVSTHGHQIADFHLFSAPQLYSASEFSVKGNEVLFHFIAPPPIPVTLVP